MDLEIPGDALGTAEREQVTGALPLAESLAIHVPRVAVFQPGPGLVVGHAGFHFVDDRLAVLLLFAQPGEGRDDLEEPLALWALGDDEAPALLAQIVWVRAVVAEVVVVRYRFPSGAFVGYGDVPFQAVLEDGGSSVGRGEEESNLVHGGGFLCGERVLSVSV
jgi:hypothetical protein